MTLQDKDKCPLCGKGMALYWSRFKKICHDCKIEVPLELKEKQQPLIKHQR